MTDNNGAPKTNCGMGIDNHRRIVALEKDKDAMWKAIDDIRVRLDRLPAWGVALVSALSGIAGAAVAVATTLALG